MISNQKWMLHAALSLAFVLSAAEARAQKLETPGSPTAEAAAAPSSSGPTTFGDGGQFVLSAERLFGYNWDHPSPGSSTNSVSILGNGYGVATYPYDWPRLGFDYFLTKSVSAGAALAFSRVTGSGDSLNAFEVAPRLGYGMMVGPWLAVWPRIGVTYINATGQSYMGLTIDLAAVIMVASHLGITFAPVANVGLTGKQGSRDQKYTTLGAEFGLTVPF